MKTTTTTNTTRCLESAWGWWSRPVRWLWRHWNVRLRRGVAARLGLFWASAAALMGLLWAGRVDGWTMAAFVASVLTGAAVARDAMADLFPGEGEGE